MILVVLACLLISNITQKVMDCNEILWSNPGWYNELIKLWK